MFLFLRQRPEPAHKQGSRRVSLRTEDRPAEFDPSPAESLDADSRPLVRRASSDFDSAAAAFEAAILAHCAPDLEWPARIAAGIRAALAFAAANPDAARALMV